MIIQSNKDNISQVFEYIGDDYEKCLYMYIDFVKYGIENENFNIWIQYRDTEIICLVSQYYTGMQIYSKNYDLEALELY